MTDIDFDKFFSQNPVDNVEFFGQIAKQVQTTVCDLAAKYPLWMYSLPSATLQAAGLNQYLFNNLCPNNPAPPAPPPPSIFAPCSKQYRVCVDIQASATGAPHFGLKPGDSFYPPPGACYNFPGPITNVYLDTEPDGSGGSVWVNCATGKQPHQTLGYSPTWFTMGAVTITSVDGSPVNDCNAPPGVSPAPPAPPDQAFNTQNNITFNNGTNLQINTKILYNPSSIVNQNQVNIPVQVSLNGDTNNYIPITISPGNVNINLSGDGQNYPNDAAGQNILSNNNFNAINNNFNALGVALGGVAGVAAQVNTTVNNNQKTIENIELAQKNCCSKKKSGTGYTAHSLPGSGGASVTGIDNLAYVEIQLNKPTLANKIQYGSNGTSNVYLQGGWACLMVGDHRGVRYPIDYEKKVFICSDFQDGFEFSVSHGGTATATYYTTN